MDHRRPGPFAPPHLIRVGLAHADGTYHPDDLGDVPERYECVEHVCSPAVTPIRLARKP